VNGTYPPTSWIDIVVGEKEVKEVSLALVQGAMIGGRVYDTNGVAMSNAQVQIFSVGYQTGFALLQPAYGGLPKTTDDRGEYRLFWIPPGDYYIGAQPPIRTGVPNLQPVRGPTIRVRSRMMRSRHDCGGEDMRGMDIQCEMGRCSRLREIQTHSHICNPDGTVPVPTIFFHLANRDLDTPATQPANNRNISLPLNSGLSNCRTLRQALRVARQGRTGRGRRSCRFLVGRACGR
jgi:hypothetical protein